MKVTLTNYDHKKNELMSTNTLKVIKPGTKVRYNKQHDISVLTRCENKNQTGFAVPIRSSDFR